MRENDGNIMDILIDNYTLLMKAAEGINTCEYLLNEEKEATIRKRQHFTVSTLFHLFSCCHGYRYQTFIPKMNTYHVIWYFSGFTNY